MSRTIALTIFIVIMASCQREAMSKKELESYLNDESHGLVSHMTRGDLTITILYRPVSLVMGESRSQESQASYDSLIYFVVKISEKGRPIESRLVRDPERLNQATSYLSSDIIDDLFIKNAGGNIHPLDVMYVGNIDMTGSTEVMAVFSKTKLLEPDDIHLLFEDHLMNSGLNEFVFRSSDIKKIPKLILN